MIDVVPDYMTALVGYRSWGVTPEGDLLSLNQNTSEPWPAKTKKGAICTQILDEAWGASQLSGGWSTYATTSMIMSSTAYVPSIIQPAVLNFAQWWSRKMVQKAHANHHAPEAGCSCGVYAAKAKSNHFRSYREGQPVWGEVYLWGKIQEYTEGYRAEFAYPKELSTSRSDLAEKIAGKYGVPCKVVGKKAAPPPYAPYVPPSFSTNVAYICSTSASTSGWDEDEADQIESSNMLGSLGNVLGKLWR